MLETLDDWTSCVSVFQVISKNVTLFLWPPLLPSEMCCLGSLHNAPPLDGDTMNARGTSVSLRLRMKRGGGDALCEVLTQRQPSQLQH